MCSAWGSNMGIFDGYLFCADCDGTMTDSKGLLAKEDAEAIRFFQKEGGLFTYATGRFPKHIDKFTGLFQPNAYQIMGNGTTIYDVANRRVVHEVTMVPPREALDYIVGEELCHLIFVDHLTHSVGWARAVEHRRPWDDSNMNTDYEVLFAPEEEGWHKINFCFETPEENVRVCRLMQERFPQYQFVCSWPCGMELLPMEGGKGNGVRYLRELLGDKAKTVVCAGDYENDISMLEAADIGYAVANASELTKAAADRITVSNDEHAIAAIIRDLARGDLARGDLARGDLSRGDLHRG